MVLTWTVTRPMAVRGLSSRTTMAMRASRFIPCTSATMTTLVQALPSRHGSLASSSHSSTTTALPQTTRGPKSIVTNHYSRFLSALSASTIDEVDLVRSNPLDLDNPSLLSVDVLGVDSDETLKVFNPAVSGHVLAHLPVMTGWDAKNCIERAHAALPSWRDETTAAQRAKYLTQWKELIAQNANDIAKIMTLESGKPLAESQGEVAYGNSFLELYAGLAIGSDNAGGGFVVPSPFVSASTGKPRGRVMAVHQAVGVCGLIAPWNFPLAMITRKAGAALAAGCTAVVKPAHLTPLTALALQNLAMEAGIPADVLQLVIADHETTPSVGTEFCTNSLVQKVSFTGSVSVGKKLYEQCSSTVKRISLELGGNAPFVVFEDADLDEAANAAVASKFRNAGQTCVCADRFLVHSSVLDTFVEKFAKATQEQVGAVGNGMDSGTQMGPMITSESVDQTHAKVKTAVVEGATLVTGGERCEGLGSDQFYKPTILRDVTPQMDIWKTETFGPVAAICSFDTEEEAIQLANDSSVGLASYFCTNNLSRAFRFSNRLETGLVGVNAGIISTATAPFGGVKESGIGREGSSMGLAEYLETKYVFMNYE